LRRVTLLGAVLVGNACCLSACAQVSVSVDAGSVKARMPATGIGLHTSVYANQFGNPVVPDRIAESGVELLRYPGGSYADIYHWTNHTATGGYAATASHFGRFAQILDQSASQAMITINYGSSHGSTMGGQPKEAAAWVAYANGDASLFGTPQDITIGVDDEGNDWRTVGYWARLRSLSPAQNTDNQYDFLAIDRDDPIGIKYWEIGNEINGNGYYSDYDPNWNWEQDLHAPPGSVDGNNPLLSPTAYGNNFNQFVAQMKAVDPTIKIGAVLTGLNGVGDVADQSRNWDRNVLLTAGENLDFVVQHFYVNNGSSTTAVLNATDDLPNWFEATRNRLEAFVGPGASQDIEIHMTEFGYFGSVDNPAVDGVFAANTYATALAEGVASAHWLELSKNSFLGDAAAQTRGPAFYGVQVFSRIAEPGAEFLSTTSSSGNIEVHSTRLSDGRVGLLIANLNSAGSSEININIAGAALAASGTTWLYGVNHTTPFENVLATGLGNVFSVSVPYRSIMAVLIDAALSLDGDYNDDGSVDAADYLVWRKTLGSTTQLDADGNQNREIDAGDYEIWQANFGQILAAGPLGLAAPPTVPEPSSSLLVVFAAFQYLARYRSYCRQSAG
jgi:hypothetical protein